MEYFFRPSRSSFSFLQGADPFLSPPPRVELLRLIFPPPPHKNFNFIFFLFPFSLFPSPLPHFRWVGLAFCSSVSTPPGGAWREVERGEGEGGGEPFSLSH